MRPACLAIVMAGAFALCGGCTSVLGNLKSSFADKAAACDHLTQTTARERLIEPCRYVDAMATCFELPTKRREEAVKACETHRDELIRLASEKMKEEG